MQRRAAFLVRRVHGGARLQQRLDHLGLAPLGRVMQRRHPLALCAVDIRSPVEQLFDLRRFSHAHNTQKLAIIGRIRRLRRIVPPTAARRNQNKSNRTEQAADLTSKTGHGALPVVLFAVFTPPQQP